jgi:siderophore synthetase component
MGHTPDVAETRAALETLLPELRDDFDAALRNAQAAIMSRLLGALDREHLPGVTRDGGIAGFRAAGGRAFRFPAQAALPFAEAPPGLAVLLRPFVPDADAPGTPADPPGAGLLTDPAAAVPQRVLDAAWPQLRPDAAGPHADPGTAGAHPGAGRAGPRRITDPAELARLLWPGSGLPAEIANSVANLALAEAAAAARNRAEPRRVAARTGFLRAAAGDPDGLGRLEQLVTDGHPLHPCCRTRAGMTTADVLAYAPEHHPVIRLRKLAVPPHRWYGDTPPILYAHPWQAARLRDRYPWLTDAGETGPVRPLMSLRTVAPIDGGDHYKTAVDVQMTSAVRTVSPAAVHNGPLLSALLAGLTRDLPLTVLAETAAGAVIVDGRPQRHLAHLRRRAPRVGPGETVLPLGAFAVPELLEEAVDDPYRWLAELATVLWTPLTQVLDRGVALEAHGQNTLVVLRGGRPVRTLYRDLGGVRVSAARLGAAGVEAPELRGDLPSDDPRVLRTKFAAAAFGTVARQLVTLLARRRGADPDRLWAIVAKAVQAAGTADVTPLLRDPLPVKATTAMRLAADPLTDIWVYLDNPMAAYA